MLALKNLLLSTFFGWAVLFVAISGPFPERSDLVVSASAAAEAGPTGSLGASFGTHPAPEPLDVQVVISAPGDFGKTTLVKVVRSGAG